MIVVPTVPAIGFGAADWFGRVAVNFPSLYEALYAHFCDAVIEMTVRCAM
jgi:hypothetical protein